MKTGFEDEEYTELVSCGYFHTLILTNKGKILQAGQTKDQLEMIDEHYMNTFFTE